MSYLWYESDAEKVTRRKRTKHCLNVDNLKKVMYNRLARKLSNKNKARKKE